MKVTIYREATDIAETMADALTGKIQPLKALSIKQPWADLILFDGKDIENRTWKLPEHMVGKQIFVHAGLQPDGRYDPRRSDRLGAILGMVQITGCVTESDSRWFEGPYGFTLANPIPFPKPIPCKGRLGFFVPKL